MKKAIVIAMVLALVLSFAACSAAPQPSASAAPSASAPASSAPASSEPASSAPASSAPASSAPAESTSAAPAGDFKIGLECAYPPYNWTQTDESKGAVPIKGASGQFAGGYDIEIAKIITKGLNRNLVVVKTAWDGLVPAVQSGVIDAIIAGMSPIPSRRESIDFTNSYYKNDIVLGVVVKKGSKYENAKSIADFAGAKITGQLGTFHYDVIDQIKGVVKKNAMKDFPAMRQSVQSGIIDGYVSEKPEGDSAMQANKKLVFVEFPQGAGFTISEDFSTIAVGLKKGSDQLVKDINTILATVSDDQRKQLMDDAIKNQPAEQ
jgi:putative lysine transport system substrate-binding protein